MRELKRSTQGAQARAFHTHSPSELKTRLASLRLNCGQLKQVIK
jgi:hypothetical protein